MLYPKLFLALEALVATCSASYLPARQHHQGSTVLDLSSISWTVTSSNVSAPAKIPSQVHLDLLAAGLIKEPTYGDNDVTQEWIALGNFTYKSAPLTTLSKSPDVLTYLVFDGIDTFADITFAGAHIASVDNQFRQWSFDVSKELQSSHQDPTILVAFNSSVPISTELADNAYAEKGPKCIDCYGSRYQFAGRQYIRKEQNDYGWDWSPGFAPQGIWQPARVVQVPKDASSISIESLYVDTYRMGQVNNLPPDQSAPWVLNVSVDYLGTIPNDTSMQVEILDSTGSCFESASLGNLKRELGRLTGDVVINGSPQLWWPAGHGSQTMYNLKVALSTKACGKPLATTQKRIGFRTIVLNQTPISNEQLAQGIAPGDNWHFEVNGHEIYVKGSNLVPPDPFWPRVTKQSMEVLFSSAVAANQNMLRVWSSNIYLPDFAYDLADEYGLLLWSELQFSDAFYPNDTASVVNYVQEVEQQVRRLNSHPSLALWCGGNELELTLGVIAEYVKYNAAAALENFESLFLYAFVHAVFDNTRSITYMASSTNYGYESFEYNRTLPIVERYNTTGPGTVPGAIYGNSDYYNYDVTQAFNLSSYPISRLANEFGFPSHSSYKTYSASIPSDQLSFNSSLMIHRNRHYNNSLASPAYQNPEASLGNITSQSLGGLGQMSQGATLYFPTPNKNDSAANFSMQIYATQLFQAELVRSQIDFYRRGSGLPQRNLGSLYWQLNDIWASPTWASLEVGGRWKLLHHVAGSAYDPVVVAPFVEESGTVSASVTSDLWNCAKGSVSLTWYDWSGKKLNTSQDWSFAGKEVEVGAINSTQIWQNNLTALPQQLKTAVAVFQVDVTSNGTQYKAERFFTPQSLSNADSIKSFANPKLSVSYDTGSDSFTVESKAVAAFVWLDQPLDSKGYFSRNGFWMLPGSQTVKFHPFSTNKTAAGWQKDVTVRSVWDLTTA